MFFINTDFPPYTSVSMQGLANHYVNYKKAERITYTYNCYNCSNKFAIVWFTFSKNEEFSHFTPTFCAELLKNSPKFITQSCKAVTLPPVVYKN